MLKQGHIAIIGGGPAGLMAAQTLAELGHSVTVYDAMPSVGRKFLLAGRGGLNLTHSEPEAVFLQRYGLAQSWLTPMVAGFTAQDLRAWAETLGQETFVGTSGRVFPKAMKASPLLRAWLAQLTRLGVIFALGCRWEGWDEAGDLIFSHRDGRKTTARADAVLLALGGQSWAKLGSDGAWVSILAQSGVDIAPLEAANCGVTVAWSHHLVDRFAGHAVKGISLSCGASVSRGDIIITKHGLEGGPIYALTPAIRVGLAAQNAHLTLDLRPDEDVLTIANRLVKAKAGQSLSSALKAHARLSPVAIGLMREACGNALPTSAMGLARLIKAIALPVTGLAPIDRAISTAGGIAQSALTFDLMLKTLPGVFAAGEMLDWEAPTGGYLLQACFASGKFAAYGVHHWVQAQT